MKAIENEKREHAEEVQRIRHELEEMERRMEHERKLRLEEAEALQTEKQKRAEAELLRSKEEEERLRMKAEAAKSLRETAAHEEELAEHDLSKQTAFTKEKATRMLRCESMRFWSLRADPPLTSFRFANRESGEIEQREHTHSSRRIRIRVRSPPERTGTNSRCS